MMELANTAAHVAVLGGIIAATLTDLRRFIIPNEAVLLVAAGGLALQWGQPHPMWLSVLAAGAVLVGFGLLSGVGVMGAGDAKLIAATTLSMPIESVLPLLLSIAVAGGGFACIHLLARQVTFQSARGHRHATPVKADESGLGRDAGGMLLSGRANKLPMPYAPAILAGVVWQMGAQVLS